jgi:streptogramin lyase
MELIDGDIWVTGDDPQDADDRYSWVRIDATTNDTENLPIDLRGGVFDQGGDAIFAVDLDSEFQSQLLRIDSRTFSEVARTELGCTADGESPDCYPMEVSSDANTAWVGLASDSLSGEVVRIDPATNEIVARIPIPQGQPLEMVIAGGSLWISAFSDSRNTNATLVRVDIETNEVVDTLFRDQLDVGNISPPVIAASEKEVWVVRRTDRGPTLHSGAILVRLDAETGEVLSESKNLQVTGSYPSVHPFAADNEGLWFYGGGTVAIHRLDVDTMEVTQSLDLSDLVKHAVEIVQDPETGTIWVVRFGGGVIRIETR